MIRKHELDPVGTCLPDQQASIPVDIFLQGGGRRGAATAGFMVGLLGYPELGITTISGTSAGGMVGAVVADGLAKEALHPDRHDRQSTRAQTANLFNIVAEFHPYNWLNSYATQTARMVSHGQQALLWAPFAALNGEFERNLKAFGTDITDQFKFYQQAMTRPYDLQHVQWGNKHPLELVLQDAIHTTKLLNSPAAPLLVVNAVKVANGEHILFHNRHPDYPMGFKNIAATGALSAYLPTIHVPHIGECRDGAEGGANPAIKELYVLKAAMGLPKTRIAVLYNLSAPDDYMAEELKARSPALHQHFLNAMAKQKQDLAELGHDPTTRKIQIYKVDAALTPAQRAEDLANTDPAKLRALFDIGLRQGKQLAEQIIADHGLASRLTARRPEAQAHLATLHR